MGEPDLFIQIFSDVPTTNVNFIIKNKDSINAILETLNSWSKRKVEISETFKDNIELSFKILCAKVLVIKIIEITPQ